MTRYSMLQIKIRDPRMVAGLTREAAKNYVKSAAVCRWAIADYLKKKLQWKENVDTERPAVPRCPMFTHWHARMARHWRFKDRATWDLLETRARSELGEEWCEAFLRFNRKEMCWSMRLALQLIETSIVVLEDREWFEDEIEEGA